MSVPLLSRSPDSIPPLKPAWQTRNFAVGIALSLALPLVALVAFLAGCIVWFALHLVAFGLYILPWLAVLATVLCVIVGIGLWKEQRDSASGPLVAVGLILGGVSLALWSWLQAASSWLSLGANWAGVQIASTATSVIIRFWLENRLWLWPLLLPIASFAAGGVAWGVIWLTPFLNAHYRRSRRHQAICPGCGSHRFPVCPACHQPQSIPQPSPLGLTSIPCQREACSGRLPTMAWTIAYRELPKSCPNCRVGDPCGTGGLPEFHVHVWSDSESLRSRWIDSWIRDPETPGEIVQSVEAPADDNLPPQVAGRPWFTWIFGPRLDRKVFHFHLPTTSICVDSGLPPRLPVDAVVALVASLPDALPQSHGVQGTQRITPLLSFLDRNSGSTIQNRCPTPVIAWIDTALESPPVNTKTHARQFEAQFNARLSRLVVHRGDSTESTGFRAMNSTLYDFILSRGT
jgi:hypothetical protein